MDGLALSRAFRPVLRRFRRGVALSSTPPVPLVVLCEVVGYDQFTTPQLVALIQVQGSTYTAPVLTVLCPVAVTSGFTVTILATALTDARTRRILVPVGLDSVS